MGMLGTSPQEQGPAWGGAARRGRGSTTLGIHSLLGPYGCGSLTHWVALGLQIPMVWTVGTQLGPVLLAPLLLQDCPWAELGGEARMEPAGRKAAEWGARGAQRPGPRRPRGFRTSREWVPPRPVQLPSRVPGKARPGTGNRGLGLRSDVGLRGGVTGVGARARNAANAQPPPHSSRPPWEEGPRPGSPCEPEMFTEGHDPQVTGYPSSAHTAFPGKPSDTPLLSPWAFPAAEPEGNTPQSRHSLPQTHPSHCPSLVTAPPPAQPRPAQPSR